MVHRAADLVRVGQDLGERSTATASSTATIPCGLVGLAAGAGSLWVASKEAGEVLRVDPANGHVQARIAMKSPWWLAYAAGAVWAVSDQGGLARIDASTNSVTATAPVPKPLSWVAAGGGFAWTANETKGTVYKVDQTGEIVATYRTGDGAWSAANGHALGRQLRRRHPIGNRRGIRRRPHLRFGHPSATPSPSAGTSCCTSATA